MKGTSSSSAAFYQDLNGRRRADFAKCDGPICGLGEPVTRVRRSMGPPSGARKPLAHRRRPVGPPGPHTSTGPVRPTTHTHIVRLVTESILLERGGRRGLEAVCHQPMRAGAGRCPASSTT
jgi:hypothetical protein